MKYILNDKNAKLWQFKQFLFNISKIQTTVIYLQKIKSHGDDQ